MKSADYITTAVSRNLKRHIVRSRSSVPTLAHLSGVSEETIVNLILKKGQARLYTVYLLAEVMGMTLDEIITAPEEELD